MGTKLLCDAASRAFHASFLADPLNSDAKEEVTQKLMEQIFRLAELTPDGMVIPWDFLYLR